MSGAWLILRRELRMWLSGWAGYLMLAALLLVDGLLFNLFGLGGKEKLSATVLSQFFYTTSGVVLVLSLLVSLRLFAEEQRDGTMILLTTAPRGEWAVTLGKWLSAWGFVAIFLLTTAWMPSLVAVRGTVGAGHVLAGYLGLLLLGAACTALGGLASSLTRSQVTAGVLGGAITTVLMLFWWLGNFTDPPLDELFSYLALHNKHFSSFMKGVIHTRDILYYASVTFLALWATRQVLRARRWG